jgi:hypothetical protein
MNRITSGAVAGAAVAAVVTLAPAAHAATTNTVTVRPGDFLSALSDTRSAGHVEFLKEGLHVWTDDASGNAKAAEYVAVSPQTLPSSASLTWYGTQPQPGSQLVFDTDGDTTTTDDSWNILVGEPVYGDDYWLTPSSDVYKNHHDLCPDTSGGSGSDCHGTLAQWQTALPNAQLYAAGFSLGSGIKGDGVIHDLQVGDTDYEFTDEPAVTTTDVTGDATVTRSEKRNVQILKVKITTEALGENEVQGHRLGFKISDNDDVVYHAKLGAGETSLVNLRFAAGTGRHKVVIVKAGEVDQTFVVKTGK